MPGPEPSQHGRRPAMDTGGGAGLWPRAHYKRQPPPAGHPPEQLHGHRLRSRHCSLRGGGCQRELVRLPRLYAGALQEATATGHPLEQLHGRTAQASEVACRHHSGSRRGFPQPLLRRRETGGGGVEGEWRRQRHGLGLLPGRPEGQPAT